jgi:hypothetical protein
MTKQICEIGASSWFYYKEICYDARTLERVICISRSNKLSLRHMKIKYSYDLYDIFYLKDILEYFCDVCMKYYIVAEQNKQRLKHLIVINYSFLIFTELFPRARGLQKLHTLASGTTNQCSSRDLSV